MTTSTQRSTHETSSMDDTSRTAAIGGAVSDAAGTAKNVAADAVARIPDVAANTRSVIDDANRQMRAGSDEMLAVGTLLSFGFAMGLLVGGANRLFVAAALTPTAAMGLQLIDRSSRARRSSSTGRAVQGS
jgi:hypothetical protein